LAFADLYPHEYVDLSFAERAGQSSGCSQIADSV